MMKNSLVLSLLLLLFACNNGEKQADEIATDGNKKTPIHEAETSSKKNIIFFGNSLTAGYGLQNVGDGYVALLQQRLDSLGLPYTAVNAGLSGETTAGGNERVDWVIRQPVDIFVLELGGNDALRGIQPESSIKHLDSIFVKVKSKYPAAKLVLAGMQAPPNMGPDYTKKFSAMYPNLAKQHGAALIPFFLAGVGGIPDLNQADRIHPNEKGQLILLENVWKVLKPLL